MKEQNYLDVLVGLFGHPVAENPSMVIQTAAFKALGLERWRYLTIDVGPDKLEDAIKGLKAFNMRGVNCTIPHKIEVIKYLDEISDAAKLSGAVNIIVNNNGKLFGDNSDGKGFMEALASEGIDCAGKKIVILGAGGAARSVGIELALKGAGKITVVNRPSGEVHATGLLKMFEKANTKADYVPWEKTYSLPSDTDILINTTPIGLYPDVDGMPDIDVASILPTMFIQDVIPNPEITPLLRAAAARGARWSTGTGMLMNQAAINMEMWTGLKPDKAVMLAAFKKEVSGES